MISKSKLISLPEYVPDFFSEIKPYEMNDTMLAQTTYWKESVKKVSDPKMLG